MEEMRLRLIHEAELPNDSKLTISVSKKVQEKVTHAAAYGSAKQFVSQSLGR